MRNHAIIPLLGATVALGGCDTSADTGAMGESTTATLGSGPVAAPAATETVIATPGATPPTATDTGTTTVTTRLDGFSVEEDGRDVGASAGR